MQSRRTERLNAELHALISQEIRETLGAKSDILCTVAKVVVSADLRGAKVFISIFPESARKRTMDALQSNRNRIEQAVYRNIPTRVKPKFSFLLDDTEEHADEVEHLLKEWHDESKEGGAV